MCFSNYRWCIEMSGEEGWECERVMRDKGTRMAEDATGHLLMTVLPMVPCATKTSVLGAWETKSSESTAKLDRINTEYANLQYLRLTLGKIMLIYDNLKISVMGWCYYKFKPWNSEFVTLGEFVADSQNELYVGTHTRKRSRRSRRRKRLSHLWELCEYVYVTTFNKMWDEE